MTEIDLFGWKVNLGYKSPFKEEITLKHYNITYEQLSKELGLEGLVTAVYTDDFQKKMKIITKIDKNGQKNVL